MVESLATAQGSIQGEPSQPLDLRANISQDEKHAKQAGLVVDNTKACATTIIAADLEKGEVTTKVKQPEDESRYLSGSKLVFLFLWVYHKFATQLAESVPQRLAALYFPK